MSEDTFGKAIKLLCGHWVYVKDINIIDGCVRCHMLEMRDNKDRRLPRNK